jgi:purine-nucleoside phosphorylase
MSLHIGAKAGEIADTVLITGDPLRAKHYAEKLLVAPKGYNRIRGMLGYTGTYQNKSVSIQGTGIGIPSTALYVHELIHSYGVKRIIRVGTCGAIQKDIHLGQVLLANKSLTDSNAINLIAKHKTDETKADSELLQIAQATAHGLGISVRTGTIFSTDLFYSDDDATRWITPTQQGVLAVEMETSVLYALAEKNNIAALSILTVSDNILTGAVASAEDRETRTLDMIRLALEII